MTSFSWFSGKRESSRKCIGGSPVEVGRDWSEGGRADDPGALHLADGGPVVLDGVVLGGPVVPDREAVRRPPPADLVLGDGRLADQVVEQDRQSTRLNSSHANI